MAAVKEHYERLLAEHYSWMSGGFSKKLPQNKKFFSFHHIRPVHSGIAVDLGAGCGFQSIPLAQAGFSVIAIDSSEKLLDELRKNAHGLSIKTVNADLVNFDKCCPGQVELVVCMGDTLTHLSTLKTIRQLLRKIFSALEKGGQLILAFRDLSAELKGLDRFISVRNDANRIFACFLEYEKHHVKVHDMIYQRTQDRWDFKKSYYKKIRIAPQWTKEVLQARGFKIETFDIQNGGVCIIASKPDHGK